jgi:hypothetical protein
LPGVLPELPGVLPELPDALPELPDALPELPGALVPPAFLACPGGAWAAVDTLDPGGAVVGAVRGALVAGGVEAAGGGTVARVADTVPAAWGTVAGSVARGPVVVTGTAVEGRDAGMGAVLGGRTTR